MSSERIQRFAANSIFPSFFLGAFGLVLVEVWVAQVSGNWRLHALLAIPGIALPGLAFYRARLHRLTGIAELREWTGDWRSSFAPRNFVHYLLLFGAGLVTAILVGSALLLGLVASLMYLVPWAKIPVCRSRFIGSIIIMLAGAIAGLSFDGTPGHPLHYVVAAWTALIFPMSMLLIVLVALPHHYRVRTAAHV